MVRVSIAFVLAALIAACSRGEEQAAPGPDATDTPGPALVADEVSGTEGSRAWRYTSVADCQVVREENEELPEVEMRCDGPAGYSLRVNDSDERIELSIIDPDGSESPLGLTRIGGGGFSSIGDTAEWRGPVGDPFGPDALIVRYDVAEQPYPGPETSYLLAIRLGPQPCVVSKIAPGPAQNAIARRRADDPGACLAD
ncbi:hypothetical protein GRI89_09425 [Altererythrobacter salegens]|uniref:Secreted protein n=1 Tax=Croceibacterium salegens TaxID=1737568 RepID=A0A6I4SW93_9SPHN|nr:hypothetical protein [Croceibacterium salegens]MXO59758.1 hypothetical protein [Croceibacterium salegens]